MNLVRLKIDIDCLLRLARCSECEVEVEDEELKVTYFDYKKDQPVVTVVWGTHEECLSAVAEAIRG